MEKLTQFKNLFIDVWKNGISGVNISEIIIALAIFFIFLVLRGFFAKFVIKRLEKYVSKTTNRFDNSLVESLKGPTKFFLTLLCAAMLPAIYYYNYSTKSTYYYTSNLLIILVR